MTVLSRVGRRSLFTAACVAACSASALAAVPAGSGTNADTRSYLEQRGVHVFSAGHKSGASSNLVDNGGKILAASHVYAIYWGTPSAFPADLHTGIANLFGGLNGSSFLGIAQQYMRGSGISSGYLTSYNDTSAPPSRSPSTSTIINEINKVTHTTGSGVSVDASAVYFVYTSNFPRQRSFCAWHDSGTVSGTTVQVAYMPNTTGVAGCDPGSTYDQTGYSQGTRSLANVSSHEFMEAITDSVPHSGSFGWIDSSGSEIGDKCAWQFTGGVKLGSLTWQLQEEWSNAITGCQQS